MIFFLQTIRKYSIPSHQSIFPLGFTVLGFVQGRRIPNFFNSISACAVILMVSYGGRVGEFLPSRPGTRKPLTIKELKKCVRFSQLTFWINGATPCTLGMFASKKAQIKILTKVLTNLGCSMVIFLKYTKSKKNMAILYEHFHIFGSSLLCPVCTLTTALLHRLHISEGPVTHSCFLFVLLTKNGFVPFATTTFVDILDRVCTFNH